MAHHQIDSARFPERALRTRRDFLRLGGITAAAIAGTGIVAACGTDATAGGTSSAATGAGSSPSSAGGSAASSAAGQFGTIDMQLGWVKNVQFCGEYMATQKGYYAANGMAVNLVSGGAAATSTEAAISTGKAWTGTSKPLTAAQARAKGAKVKIIGAVMQDGGHAILSPADKPLKTPKDLIGKRVGVSEHTKPDFLALLKANDIDASQVTIVPVQFDPTPLANGEVDAWDGYSNNEPVSLAQQGFKTYLFTYADFGLPMCAQVLEVAEESLTKDRDKVKAFLKAEAQGWKDAIADPKQAVTYCVDVFGKDLKLGMDNQTAVFAATIPLVVNDWTKKNGLMTLSDDAVAATLKSLAATGTTTTAADLFDLSILQEVYAENPDLI